MIPVDADTGLQSGPALRESDQLVIVGYLVTHPDGYQVRMPPDRTRAELYAARQHATVEVMFVRRFI